MFGKLINGLLIWRYVAQTILPGHVCSKTARAALDVFVLQQPFLLPLDVGVVRSLSCPWTGIYYKLTVLPLEGLSAARCNASGHTCFTWTCSICSTLACVVPGGVCPTAAFVAPRCVCLPTVHLDCAVYKSLCSRL
jgi:hypothetical protein